MSTLVCVKKKCARASRWMMQDQNDLSIIAFMDPGVVIGKKDRKKGKKVRNLFGIKKRKTRAEKERAHIFVKTAL